MRFLPIAFFLGTVAVPSTAWSNPACDLIANLARAADAETLKDLSTSKNRMSNDYRSRLVYTARRFELDHSDKNVAGDFFKLLPDNDAKRLVWMTLGDALCPAESAADMESLANLSDRLSRDWAKAVLLVPTEISRYILLSFSVADDPHNNYSWEMERVCRANHIQFVGAVRKLSATKRDWFVHHILQPRNCRAVALPEAK